MNEFGEWQTVCDQPGFCLEMRFRRLENGDVECECQLNDAPTNLMVLTMIHGHIEDLFGWMRAHEHVERGERYGILPPLEWPATC